MATSYLSKNNSLWDWLTTVDHKRIGTLYFFAGILFFAIGGLEALLMRIQLMFPLNDFLDGSTFNQLMTMHGTTMLFFAATPILFGFMNWVVPLQIGARDVAFPFLNSLGFWLFLFGALLMNTSFFLGGAPEAGWTSYVPLALNYSGTDFFVIGLQISGIGTILGAINFLTTIFTMRAPGMTLLRMPMFTWTTVVASALILFAFTPLTGGLTLIMFERLFNASFFDVAAGGNTVIYEHIFWIFGHPEVYLLVLPAFGIISDVLATFSTKRLFGYHSMVFATIMIGFIGFMIWVHHMFTVGMGPITNSVFGIATMLVGIPTGIKVFNWLFTMIGGKLHFTTAGLFAMSFIPNFLIGGVTGVMLAAVSADYQFHDTYFVVAHFHYIIVGGIVQAVFAGIFYWWPKMFGRKLNEKLGKWTFWLMLIGYHMTFFIQHFLGLWGMPRRVYTYLPNQGLDMGNFISSMGAIFMGASVLLLVINMIITFFRGEVAEADPWNGRTLEWAIPSPPPEYNFAQLPLVRANDPWWHEKMQGNKAMIPAEPLGEIHMPNPSILPLIMSLGLFIAGYGFIYHKLIVVIIGLAITFGTMFVRSVVDDLGHHIEPDEKEGVHSV
ncbi:cytochrome c oxidase subunit I [Brevibacillus marinus]|uniref:cytochrome c oxidase subunit I n=1 Tax=Brevibacillus marinus TaxID=2496837 RepID=UPI000F847BF9|nr:cbb3-type cytochrome c oxidase subunit I [Brevibacillus marinus]